GGMGVGARACAAVSLSVARPRAHTPRGLHVYDAPLLRLRIAYPLISKLGGEVDCRLAVVTRRTKLEQKSLDPTRSLRNSPDAVRCRTPLQVREVRSATALAHVLDDH